MFVRVTIPVLFKRDSTDDLALIVLSLLQLIFQFLVDLLLLFDTFFQLLELVLLGRRFLLSGFFFDAIAISSFLIYSFESTN